MTIYFFDVSRSGETSHDQVGSEFDSLESAVRDGVIALGEMTRDELRNPKPLTLSILVRDDTGAKLATLSAEFQLTLHRGSSL
jgi:hypothetical protein